MQADQRKNVSLYNGNRIMTHGTDVYKRGQVPIKPRGIISGRHIKEKMSVSDILSCGESIGNNIGLLYVLWEKFTCWFIV